MRLPQSALFVAGLAFFSFPAPVLAQSVQGPSTLTTVLIAIGDLIEIATPLVAGLAILYFFWGLAEYILVAAEEKKKQEAVDRMVWGTIALFVMLSVWGLALMIAETFGLNLSGFNTAVPIDSSTQRPETLTDIINRVTNLLNATWPVLRAAVLLVFFWGIAQFITAAGDTEKRKKAQATLLWGILILTLLFSFGSVIGLIQRTFFGDTTGGGSGPPVQRDAFGNEFIDI
jgi:lysylphosphatidylglycerol synthetase-like protein (DUF2156 family)